MNGIPLIACLYLTKHLSLHPSLPPPASADFSILDQPLSVRNIFAIALSTYPPSYRHQGLIIKAARSMTIMEYKMKGNTRPWSGPCFMTIRYLLHAPRSSHQRPCIAKDPTTP